MCQQNQQPQVISAPHPALFTHRQEQRVKGGGAGGGCSKGQGAGKKECGQNHHSFGKVQGAPSWIGGALQARESYSLKPVH